MALEAQVINIMIKEMVLKKNKDILLTDTSKEKKIAMRNGQRGQKKCIKLKCHILFDRLGGKRVC